MNPDGRRRPIASTGMCRSVIAAPKTSSARRSGPTTGSRHGCGRWWSRPSGIWPTRGRCAAGGGAGVLSTRSGEAGERRVGRCRRWCSVRGGAQKRRRLAVLRCWGHARRCLIQVLLTALLVSQNRRRSAAPGHTAIQGVGRGPLRGDSMRRPSSRTATVAALIVGVAAVALVGRLVKPPASIQPSSVPATTSSTIPPAATIVQIRVPDEIGQPLGRAQQQLRAAGLKGVAYDRDPQGPQALVVAQEPPAGELAPPGSVIGLRTGTDLRVWLEPGPGERLHVTDSTSHDPSCKPLDQQVSCWIELGELPAEGAGAWTMHVAKRSTLAVTVEITVTFERL